MKGIIENKEFINEPFLQNMVCIPRPSPDDKIDIILPWNFKNSVFAPYKPDDDYILNKCFEFDWNCSKIQSLLKNADGTTLLRIKAVLRSYYKGMREAFKYYGAIGPNGMVASVGTNVFMEILSNLDNSDSKLIDESLIKMSEADLEFVATNAGTKMKNPQNPDRQLIRFQFMEVWTRIAI